jgi:hypothetical protein
MVVMSKNKDVLGAESHHGVLSGNEIGETALDIGGIDEGNSRKGGPLRLVWPDSRSSLNREDDAVKTDAIENQETRKTSQDLAERYQHLYRLASDPTYRLYVSAPSGFNNISSLNLQPLSLSSIRLFKLPAPTEAFPFFSPAASSSSSSLIRLIGLLLRSSARRYGKLKGNLPSW